MWHQFTFNCPYKIQTDLIFKLKQWILELEDKGIIKGFSFNHYTGNITEDHLSIRFNCEEDVLEIIEQGLEMELEKKCIKIGYEKSIWSGHDYVLKAYEVGSRCTFFMWDLVERGILPKEYLDNFLGEGIKQMPFQFQLHFFHGLSNSLRITKYPNEQVLRLFALFEYYQAKNIHELYDKMNNDQYIASIRSQ